MRNRGSSLFELVVALGVMGLVLLALASLATLSVRNATFSRNESQAARLGQELIEWLRSERDRNWTEFVGKVIIAPTRCIKATDWNQAPAGPCGPNDLISNTFKRQADFEASDTDGNGSIDTVDVVLSISWADGQGDHIVKNSTRFTNWRLK